MSTEFVGKRVLVTGGGNGLGKATVQRFYEAGATVFALDRNEDALKQLKAEFPKVNLIPVDLLDWNATRKAVEAVLPIHHLVNNAAIIIGGFLEVTEATIDRMFAVNFKAAFNITQLFANGAIEHKLSGGTIVNISSFGDSIAVMGNTTYHCTKAALHMLTKCSANELGKYNIRVNAIRPTSMKTTILDETLPDHPEIWEAAKATLARAPLKTPLELSDAANLIYFLSSSQSSIITGEAVAIDGGLLIA